jgi:hypothetical protein
MKRDWDMIREVLIEVEGLSATERDGFTYGAEGMDQNRTDHALLLWKAGFIEGMDAGSQDGPALMSPELTWQGHNMLATVRSKPVWEKIKSTAQEKGLELSFDTVIALGKAAVAWVIAQGS